MLADTFRRRLHEAALDQYGYVTVRDAERLGVPAVELRKISHRGGVTHIAYGLYRFEDIPLTGREEYMEAVLRVGVGAYLTHDAVLALHDLGLVNPRRIKVGTSKRVRQYLPDHIEVVRRDLAPSELTTYEGIATTTVAKALVDCRGIVMRERLIEAAHNAARMGLLKRGEVDRVLDELEKR